MTTMEQKIEAFKQAWHAADEAGATGSRVEAGLRAVEALDNRLLAEYRDRMHAAERRLEALAADADNEMMLSGATRLYGKASGVRLARSYLDEMTRE